MFLGFFIAIAVIGALLQIFISKEKRDAVRVLKVFLIWFLVINGVQGLFGFYAHVFMANATAKLIGWPAGNPFQFEIGIANLVLAALGIMSAWLRDGFRLAAVVSMTIFGWGAAYGHVVQIVRFNNYAPGNAGLPLYSDILMPIILISLYAGYKITQGRSASSSKERHLRNVA